MPVDPEKNLLFVDADPVQRKAGAALLRDMGYSDVLTPGHGDQAWSIIKSQHVDFVFSAWRLLPEMSGLDLLKVIRADLSHAAIPFILIVEEITKSQVIEAGEAGVTDIILRPFTRETFKRKMTENLLAEDDPQTREVRRHLSQGVSLMKQRRYNEALAAFKKVLQVYQNAEVYYNLGYIKTAQGKYEEAIQAFRRATQINNAYAQAYQKMGEVYALLGRQDEAQQCLEKAGEIYMDKNMHANAEQSFMQALAVNPRTINIYNSLGILYRRQAKYTEAMRMYQKAMRVNSRDENICYNLARVHLALRQFNEAGRILRRSLEINPAFQEARELLKSIEMGKGI